MHVTVVVSAEQHSVVEVGACTFRPGSDVVGFAPAGWSFASGERAAAVAVGECFALCWCVESLFAAEVEDLVFRAEYGGQDAGVAGELA